MLHLFERTTEVCGFSNVENMVRLRKCLKGKAKEAVQAALAVATKAKAKATVPIKDGKPEALLSFSNTVRNLSTTMTLLRRSGHNTNPQLLEELVKKLPSNEQCCWAKRIHKRILTSQLSPSSQNGFRYKPKPLAR